MATPTAGDVLQVLEAAAFQREQSKEQAELATRQLEEWQNQPGFHALLGSIAQDKSSSPTTRILALTQLKNGIDRHWRAGSAITTDEQNIIRTGLQHINLDESDGRLVTLTAVIFASIARRDFPSKWPSLFEDLATLFQSAVSSQQHQFAFALKVIQKTITDFQTLRLANPRKAYQNAAPKFFHVLATDQSLRTVITSTAAPGSDARQAVFHAVLLFKCLRRLAVGAFECPHYNDAVVSFWKASQRCLEVGMADQHFDDQWWMALMRQIVKLHLLMAQNHPVTFSLLEPSDLVQFYWNTSTALRRRQLAETGELDEALEDGLAPFFILRALTLLRACFKAAYNSVHTMKFAKNRDPNEPSWARDQMKTRVLTPEFVARMFEDLISTYLIYSPGDIEEWTDEAEEWEIREYDAEDAFEQSLRPCAERVFLDITLWYKDLIMEPLLQLAQRYAPSDDVFIKDAVYSALGIASARISDRVDFNQFLENYIVNDMTKTAPNYNIIRRRISIILAQWVPITDAVSPSNKEKVFAIYRSLLDPSDARNDQVVRVTAGKRFKDICDDFAFDANTFRPYAAGILQYIVDLMIEVQLPDNKLALLETLQCIIERMDATVIQFADQIVNLLQKFWMEVEKHQLIKKAIVSVLAKLTGSLKAASAPLQQFVIPLLRQVLDPNASENLYLWEDSLDLLHELIQQSEYPPNPPLVAVALDYIATHADAEGQRFDKLLQIAESLTILDANGIVQGNRAQTIFLTLSKYMKHQNTSHAATVASCYEYLVRASMDVGGEAKLQTLIALLDKASFIHDAMDCILGCWSAHQSHGPHRNDPPASARSETYYFVILARITLISPAAFVSLMHIASQQRGAKPQGIWDRVLGEWFSHLDNVGSITRSKMMVMALTRLMDSDDPWMLTKLQDYVTMWTSLLLELRNDENGKGGDSTLLSDEYTPQQNVSPEMVRERQWSERDPMHTVNMYDFVKERVDAVVGRCGGYDKFKVDYLANVDVDVWKQFVNLF